MPYQGGSYENNGYSNPNNGAPQGGGAGAGGYNPLHTGFGGNPNANGGGYTNSPRYQNNQANRRQPRETFNNGYQNGNRGTYRGTIGGNTKVTPLNFNYS